MPLLGGRGAAYIALRGRHAPFDHRPNEWFRLILIGGGRTFRKLDPFGTRGATGPTTRPIGLGGPP
jgi:hypothetical protein